MGIVPGIGVERQKGEDSCLGGTFVVDERISECRIFPAHDKSRLAETPREDSLPSIRYKTFGGRP